MASTIIRPASPDFARPFAWVTWYCTPGPLTGTIDFTIDTLPAGTIILDARLVTVGAASGVSTCNIDIEIGATGIGDTTLISNNADGGSVLGDFESVNTDANKITINAVSLGGSALVVNAEVTYGGTETLAPTFALSLLCGRNDY